jgi:methylenetetrahydrofolate dehydrogenase (NADP+)/methenyltetrahydrofolate cyclohydrolase
MIEKLEAEIIRRGDQLAAFGNLPRMAVVVVGEDPAARAQAYGRVQYGTKLGINVEVQEYATHTSPNSLMKAVRRLNGDSEYDGILLELPLPNHFSEGAVLEEIYPERDISGYHPANLGRVLSGEEEKTITPVIPQACIRLLKGENLRSKRVLILGQDREVARPLMAMLINRGAYVTMMNVEDPEKVAEACCQAETLVVTGEFPVYFNADMFREKTTLIYAGENKLDFDKADSNDLADLNEKIKLIDLKSSGMLGRLLSALTMRNLILAAEHGRD